MAKDRLIDLTVDEFIQLVKGVVSGIVPQQQPTEFIEGVVHLAEFMGVCRSTAFYWVKSGQLDSAMYKVGKVYRFDKAKVLEIMNNKECQKKDN